MGGTGGARTRRSRRRLGPGHGAGVLLDAGARSVVGVDHDPDSVEVATRLYGSRARFLRREALALPFARAQLRCGHLLRCARDGAGPGERARRAPASCSRTTGCCSRPFARTVRTKPAERSRAKHGRRRAWSTSPTFACTGAGCASRPRLPPSDLPTRSASTRPRGSRGRAARTERCSPPPATRSFRPSLPLRAMTDFRDLRQYQATRRRVGGARPPGGGGRLGEALGVRGRA